MTLIYEKNNNIARISLSRPEVMNAFNAEMISDLTDAFTDADSDSRSRLVLIDGLGKNFCSGADLNWMAAARNYTDQQNKQDSTKLSEMFRAAYNCRKPIICKVRGMAFGGGSGLVAVSDFVIAERNSKFGFTEVRLGLVPAVISEYVVPKIGYSASVAYFTSGIRFNAEEALRIGLIHKVADEESLDSAADEVISEYLKCAPLAMIEAKKLARLIAKGDSNSSHLIELIANIRKGSEAAEGISAVLEKRKPNFS